MTSCREKFKTICCSRCLCFACRPRSSWRNKHHVYSARILELGRLCSARSLRAGGVQHLHDHHSGQQYLPSHSVSWTASITQGNKRTKLVLSFLMQTKWNAALRSLSFSKGNKSALPCFTETCIFLLLLFVILNQLRNHKMCINVQLPFVALQLKWFASTLLLQCYILQMIDSSIFAGLVHAHAWNRRMPLNLINWICQDKQEVVKVQIESPCMLQIWWNVGLVKV